MSDDNAALWLLAFALLAGCSDVENPDNPADAIDDGRAHSLGINATHWNQIVLVATAPDGASEAVDLTFEGKAAPGPAPTWFFIVPDDNGPVPIHWVGRDDPRHAFEIPRDVAYGGGFRVITNANGTLALHETMRASQLHLVDQGLIAWQKPLSSSGRSPTETEPREMHYDLDPGGVVFIASGRQYQSPARVVDNHEMCVEIGGQSRSHTFQRTTPMPAPMPGAFAPLLELFVACPPDASELAGYDSRGEPGIVAHVIAGSLMPASNA